MDSTPAVSCMCLTYGRPQVLEEAIYSFLKQDYAGTKELIILNDLPEQRLVLEHPEVAVVNVPRRFRTVGEKRNACAALASHDLLFVWDDDDIFLPHRLSYSVKMLDPAKGFFKPSKALTLNNGKVAGPNSNLYHSGSCFTKALFDQAHGYRHMGSGQDLDFEVAVEKIVGRPKNFNGIKPADIYYVYRWGGTNSYHLSGFGADRPGQTPGNRKVEQYVQRKIESGELSLGETILEPQWTCDYNRLVAEYLALLPQAAKL